MPEIPIDELIRFSVEKSGLDKVIKSITAIGNEQRKISTQAATGQKAFASSVERSRKETEQLNKRMKEGELSQKEIKRYVLEVSRNLNSTSAASTRLISAWEKTVKLMGESSKNTKEFDQTLASVLKKMERQAQISRAVQQAGIGTLQAGARGGVAGMAQAIPAQVGAMTATAIGGPTGLVVEAIIGMIEQIINYQMMINAESRLLSANLGHIGGQMGGTEATADKLRIDFAMTTKEATEFLTTLVRAGGEASELVRYADDFKAREVLWGIAAAEQVKYMEEMQNSLGVSSRSSNILLTNILNIGASLEEWTAQEFLNQTMALVRHTRDLNMSVESTLAFFAAMADTRVLEKSGFGDLAKVSKEGRLELTQAITSMYQLEPGLQVFLARAAGIQGTPVQQLLAVRRGELAGPRGLEALFGVVKTAVGGRRGPEAVLIAQEMLAKFAPQLSPQTRFKLGEIFAERIEEGAETTHQDFVQMQSMVDRIQKENKSPIANIVDDAAKIAKDMGGIKAWLQSFLAALIEKLDQLIEKWSSKFGWLQNKELTPEEKRASAMFMIEQAANQRMPLKTFESRFPNLMPFVKELQARGEIEITNEGLMRKVEKKSTPPVVSPTGQHTVPIAVPVGDEIRSIELKYGPTYAPVISEFGGEISGAITSAINNLTPAERGRVTGATVVQNSGQNIIKLDGAGIAFAIKTLDTEQKFELERLTEVGR